MQNSRPATSRAAALLTFPKLTPADEGRRNLASAVPLFPPLKTVGTEQGQGHVRSSMVSFANMHLHGDLLVGFMRARKKTFIDRLNWQLPEVDGMEFDQYDTPRCRWVIVHEFGEVIAGIRLTPTTAKCGVYSYMLRDAQRGLLDEIPRDVLFFEAPVSNSIWEASRLFISAEVPSERRNLVQSVLMETLSRAAREMGASQVIGIVPSVWSRWLRRLDLDAVPVGPKFEVDGTTSQAALFNTTWRQY